MLADDTRLEQQIRFLLEIDKLKCILRRTWLTDGTRLENSAEHSWHLAVMAILLAEYAAEETLDLFRVVQMALVHDLVEIDAGDTFVYDEAAAADKAQREQAAAERIFGLLPPEQGDQLRSAWQEFEARQTAEARFAAALDRLQPILHNYHTCGKAWQTHGITADRVLDRNRHMSEGAPQLWEYTQTLIADAVAKGYLTQ